MYSSDFTSSRRQFKREPEYITFIFLIWAMLLVISILLTNVTATSEKSRYYDLQIEAATLAKEAMDAVKEFKIELGIPIPDYDILQSGMIGESLTRLTTTSGVLEAKRTAVNPDFAAVYIDMFKEVGLKKGDEIAIITSGSFPTLNISAMAAAQVYGLEVCLMSSVGASSYGANYEDFTFFDMAEYLYSQDILKHRIDYISFGGSNDDGLEFPDDLREKLLKKFTESKIPFLCESDLEKNVKNRTELIFRKCPNVKLLISVGGTLVAMGEGYGNTTTYRGLVKPSYLTNRVSKNGKIGLLDTFLVKGIPVIQMLNVKGISLDYGIPYDPVELPEIGVSKAYYEISYPLSIPLISIGLSFGLIVFYCIYRRKHL